jgi:SAM-dependent methyltransferase
VSDTPTPDFDARADVYDTLRPTDALWWERFAALVELGDLRGRRILDVGCGTGRLAEALAAEARAKVWGIDASAQMVAVARASVPAGVGIRQGDATALPFRDGWFDRVTMSLVVHLLDRPRAFAEARRVLGGGGRLAIGTFLPDHFATFWLVPYFPSIAAIDAGRFPAPAELERELAAAGFATFETPRLVGERTIEREDALSRIRGRHISTFDLLAPDELAEGTARAERELPETVVVRLDQLVAVGHVDGRGAVGPTR